MLATEQAFEHMLAGNEETAYKRVFHSHLALIGKRHSANSFDNKFGRNA